MRTNRFGIALLPFAAAAALAGDPATDTARDAAKTPAAPPAARATPAAATTRPADGASPDAASARAPAPPAPRTLGEALSRLSRTHVDVAFEGVTLAEAAQFLGRVGRMNVLVSPLLRAPGDEALPRIDLRLRRVSLRQFAELCAKLTSTRLVLRDGILLFTTPADARGKPVLRIFALAELTMRLRNFPGPDLMLRPAGAEFEPEKESDVESAFDDPQAVVELLRRFTGEGTWEDEGVSIAADERRLIVRQYPEVLREIGRFLAVLRAAK